MEVKTFLEQSIAAKVAEEARQDAFEKVRAFEQDSIGLRHLIGIALSNDYSWRDTDAFHETMRNEILTLPTYELADHPDFLFAEYGKVVFAYHREGGTLHIFKLGQVSKCVQWMQDTFAMLENFIPFEAPDAAPLPMTYERLAQNYDLSNQFHELDIEEINHFNQAGLQIEVISSQSARNGRYLVQLRNSKILAAVAAAIPPQK